jgi:hypothetical protein
LEAPPQHQTRDDVPHFFADECGNVARVFTLGGQQGALGMKYFVCAGAVFCAMAFCAIGLAVSDTMDYADGYALTLASQDIGR